MPSKDVTTLGTKLDEMHTEIVKLQTDAVWIKRIIIGAAGLGFLEKVVGWMVGR